MNTLARTCVSQLQLFTKYFVMKLEIQIDELISLGLEIMSFLSSPPKQACCVR